MGVGYGLVDTEVPLSARSFDELLEAGVRFHGHLCPGQVLGVRMVLAGCREVGIERPNSAGKRLVIFVEIDRCATDAIQALTGVSVGKRTLKPLDYGKTAATFVDVTTGTAVRVAARDDARVRATEWGAGAAGPREAQISAYRTMPESDLLAIQRVAVAPGWLDRRRVRVPCEGCGEGINYERQVVVGGRTLCRPCAGQTYYVAL
ncbi:MAG: FmdE family protein [Candidatus Rokuibacteriota bacterium]